MLYSSRSSLLLIILLASTLQGLSQLESNPFFVNRLPYIVKIQADFPYEDKYPGFGFVVSLNEQNVYIVTASHVVHPPKIRRTAPEIKISWYKDSISQKAQVIQLDTMLDIALLRVPNQTKLDWHYHYRYTQIEEGDSARVVGLGGQWERPSHNNLAVVTEKTDTLLKISFDRVTGGSSGGPIVNQEGVIGMIIKDNGNGTDIVEVLPISVIMDKVNQWIPYKPLNRSVFPLFTFGFGVSRTASTTQNILQTANRRYGYTGWSWSIFSEVAWNTYLASRVQYAPRRLIGRSYPEIPFRNRIHHLSASMVVYPMQSYVNPGLDIGFLVGADRFWHRPELRIDHADWTPLAETEGVDYPVSNLNSGFHLGFIVGGFWRNGFIEMCAKYNWTNGAYFYKDLPDYQLPDLKNDPLITVDIHLGFTSKKYKSGGYILSPQK
jgi:hypothetical protein